MNRKTIDPRNAEQLGRFLYDTYHRADHGAELAAEWEQLGDREKARWLDVARETHERFAVESAADVPVGGQW